MIWCNQMSLASSPFEAGVDEFEKAGFTPVVSDTIRPFRVKESPVQLECKVLEVKELGENGGAGNLVICEVLKIHISESVLDQKGMIDQEKIDLVSRMGGNWYCRANGESLFEVDKPLTAIGIGVDALPAKIKMCKELTGNDLGILGNLQSIPNDEEMTHELTNLSENLSIRFAKQLLTANKPITAYAVLSKLL